MILEYSFIALLAFLSILVSQTKNVFMSLMYSILLYINSFVVLLSLGFEFLAIINVLVYVGALAVLFLFVIMLLEIPSTELRAYYRGYSGLAMLGFLSVRLFSVNNSHTIFTFIPTLESISNVGYAFYIVYADVLVLNSLILTIALFGALVLAHNQSS
uniref:NADH-ubiquinone oxidoreductase chain 6 n=1 Tax=Dunaliella salina TaxID=3046 RepID=A0A1C9FRX0_DUNSA|nr:NADH dehydrogenase subunit 6 [Dunaliella salina]